MAENTPSDLRPTLRHLDVRHEERGSQTGVVLTDPLGISDQQVFVPTGLLPIIGRFDGSHTIGEIKAMLTQEGGQTLPSGMIEGLYRQLDGCDLMDSERFRRRLDRLSQQFLAQEARPSSHAGVSAGYPGTATAATAALESMIRRPESDRDLPPSPRGLVAPHIDLARGREGYSMAYGALAECRPADLYVVFGTGHQGPSAPVTGLPLDWATPIGTMATDRDYIAAIHDRLGPAHSTDLFLHQAEHSLEFQMLFLRHLVGDHPCQVAGFLTGHLPPTGTVLAEQEHIQALLEAFRRASAQVEAAGRRVCYIAGADLAHIGPGFGDPAQVDEIRLAELAETEHRRLKHLEDGQPSAFHAAVEDDGNPDRICGTTPMFLTASLAGGPGRLLHYGQSTADAGELTVSFCSMVF